MAEGDDLAGLWGRRALMLVVAALFVAGFVKEIVKLRRDVVVHGEKPMALGTTLFLAVTSGMLATTVLVAPFIWAIEGGFKLVVWGVKSLAGAVRRGPP